MLSHRISCNFHTSKPNMSNSRLMFQNPLSAGALDVYFLTNYSVSVSCLTILPAWVCQLNVSYVLKIQWIAAFTCIPPFSETWVTKLQSEQPERNQATAWEFFPLSVEQTKQLLDEKNSLEMPIGITTWRQVLDSEQTFPMDSMADRSPDRSRRMTPWVSFNIKQWHGEGVRQTGSFFFPVEMMFFSMFYAGFLAFRRSFFFLFFFFAEQQITQLCFSLGGWDPGIHRRLSYFQR